MNLNLANILVDTKVVTFKHPTYEGFSVDIRYNSKTVMADLRASCTEAVFDPSLGYPVQKYNSDKFTRLFCENVITGWSGFKLKYLADMILIDEDSIEDMDAEMEFSADNAFILLTKCTSFDSWVNSCVSNISNFRNKK